MINALFGTVSEAAQIQSQPPKYVCEPVKDHDWGMCLASLEGDETLLGDRIPVIMIHGWNRDEIPGQPDLKIWRGLARHFHESQWFNKRYKMYFVFYLSNIQSIRNLGLNLVSLVDQMDSVDPDFRGKPLVIIGHSMGGLIARSYMQETRTSSRGLPGERVLRLITLGTPHHGTPIANGPARDNKAGVLARLLFQWVDNGLFNSSLDWPTDNRYDLRWDNYDHLLDYEQGKPYPEGSNLFLERLNSGDTFEKKIVAYAGTVKPFTQFDDCVLSFFRDPGCLAGLMKESLGVGENDGVIPLSSALFYPCNGCLGTRVYAGYDHDEIAGGKYSDDPLFWDISGNLLSLVMPHSNGPDNYVDLGNPDDERFHSLFGWDKVNPGLLPRSDTDRTSRYQSFRGQSSVDLFVAEPMTAHRLTFRSEAGYCDDSFEVYVNNYLVHKYAHDMKPNFPIHSVPLPAEFIPSSRVKVVFQNMARDNCGLAAIYYVRLDPM